MECLYAHTYTDTHVSVLYIGMYEINMKYETYVITLQHIGYLLLAVSMKGDYGVHCVIPTFDTMSLCWIKIDDNKVLRVSA